MNKEITNIYYCKETDVPITKTRKRFLKEFLYKRPRTYYKNDNIQCESGTSRSITELVSITRSRFPNTSLEAVIRIIAELNYKGRCYVVWCTQVNKFVVHSGYDDGQTSYSFFSNHAKKYYSTKTGVDGLSYEEIIKIKENEFN